MLTFGIDVYFTDKSDRKFYAALYGKGRLRLLSQQNSLRFTSTLTVKWDLNDESKHYKLNIMENISTACVFIIVVVNIFITAFGVQRPSPPS